MIITIVIICFFLSLPYLLISIAGLFSKGFIETYFPQNMEVLFKYDEHTFGEAVQVEVYALYDCDAVDEDRLSSSKEWESLPMSNSDYELYINNCCLRASSKLQSLELQMLCSSETAGYWTYRGDYTVEKSEPWCYFGSQECFVYLPQKHVLIHLYNYE